MRNKYRPCSIQTGYINFNIEKMNLQIISNKRKTFINDP